MFATPSCFGTRNQIKDDELTTPTKLKFGKIEKFLCLYPLMFCIFLEQTRTITNYRLNEKEGSRTSYKTRKIYILFIRKDLQEGESFSIFSQAVFGENPRYCYSLGVAVVVVSVAQKL